RAQAATAGQELTYTCVPFGSGTRIGIDRDLDGCLDFDDGAPADPTTCAASGTTTTTSTSSSTTTTSAGSSTTTTTVPGSSTTTTAPGSSTTTTTKPPSTTTTTTASTTTTTQPGSCTPVADPKANVNVTAHNDAGRVNAKMVIDLAGYTNQAVTVSLADGDPP